MTAGKATNLRDRFHDKQSRDLFLYISYLVIFCASKTLCMHFCVLCPLEESDIVANVARYMSTKGSYSARSVTRSFLPVFFSVKTHILTHDFFFPIFYRLTIRKEEKEKNTFWQCLVQIPLHNYAPNAKRKCTVKWRPKPALSRFCLARFFVWSGIHKLYIIYNRPKLWRTRWSSIFFSIFL